MLELNEKDRISIQETTGHPPFSVELKITDDDGNKLPNDGKNQGKLWSRGAAVVQKYLKTEQEAVDKFGWFDTGDVATIDKNGYMRITDRSKDIIKSGGEWISQLILKMQLLDILKSLRLPLLVLNIQNGMKDLSS